jgi:hypothetical protein
MVAAKDISARAYGTDGAFAHDAFPSGMRTDRESADYVAYAKSYAASYGFKLPELGGDYRSAKLAYDFLESQWNARYGSGAGASARAYSAPAESRGKGIDLVPIVLDDGSYIFKDICSGHSIEMLRVGEVMRGGKKEPLYRFKSDDKELFQMFDARGAVTNLLNMLSDGDPFNGLAKN